jgi:hypothetical protein
VKHSIMFLGAVISIQAVDFQLPEIYQDVFIEGKIVKNGIRECSKRYEVMKEIFKTLPFQFKALDIGASQGYFSFRMTSEFRARCTLIEGGYTTTNTVWQTGDYLRYLCEQNKSLKDMTLLTTRVYASDLRLLHTLEEFDVVLALSVIHHMKEHEDQPNTVYEELVDAILSLAPVVFIETPVNTGPHTQIVKQILYAKGGELIYSSRRGTLIYELYLFNKGIVEKKMSILPNLQARTYTLFGGSYKS